MDAPCSICHGRLGRIHYEEPSDSKHPLSFVIDETLPVSRWKEFGYESPEAVCKDINNLGAAHYCCNQAKGARTSEEAKKRIATPIKTNGDW